MTTESVIGRGYVELAVRDRGYSTSMRQAVVDVQAWERSTAVAASRVRASLATTNNVVQQVAQSAAAGRAPFNALADGVVALSASAGAAAGPIGAIVGLMTSIVGINFAKWMADGTKEADRLATSMKAVKSVSDAVRGASIAAAIADTPAEGVAAEVAAAAAAREALDVVDAHQAGNVSEVVNRGRQTVQGFAVEQLREAALIEEQMRGNMTIEDREKALKRVVGIYRDLRDVAKGAVESTKAPGDDYERFVNILMRANAELRRVEEQLGGIEGMKRDRETATRQRKNEERYREEVAKRNEEASRLANQRADEVDAELSARAEQAARERGHEVARELDAVRENAERVRAQHQTANAEQQQREKELADMLSVAMLRSTGQDAQAEALARSQRFARQRAAAGSDSERQLVDQLEAAENARAGRKGIATKVGSFAAGIGALQSSLLQDTSGAAAASTATNTAKTAKAAETMAERAREQAERAKERNRILKSIESSLKNGVAGAFA